MGCGKYSRMSLNGTFGEARNAQEALNLVWKENWDVVVLDISLGERNGLDVLKDLQQLRPRLPVLILSMHAEEQYARRAFKAGAAGYITKDSSRAELVTALNKVIHGGKYISPMLAEKFADTRFIELQIGPIDSPILHSPSAVNMGNPHAIFWVEDVAAYDLARIGHDRPRRVSYDPAQAGCGLGCRP